MRHETLRFSGIGCLKSAVVSVAGRFFADYQLRSKRKRTTASESVIDDLTLA